MRNAFLEVKQEFGSFDEYVWRFVNGKPLKRKPGQPIAARTEISDALSKDLLKRGFKFVGSTICYSFMQAVGMVNDHDSTCFRYRRFLPNLYRNEISQISCNLRNLWILSFATGGPSICDSNFCRLLFSLFFH